MQPDLRTTPEWARIPVLVGLGMLAAYFVACFHYAMADSIPRWALPAVWQMFTVKSNWHFDITAQAEVDGQWVDLDLLEMFPSRWESGPRYLNGFRFNKAWQQILADSACDRDPRHPERVRLTELDWPVEPGIAAGVHHKLKTKPLLDWRCADTARRPKGVRW
jgi:hypothetical protein